MTADIRFININAIVGYGTAGASDYPDVHTLQKQMDRLGIGLSIVYAAAAQSYDPVYGNAWLLEELRHTDCKNRFIPALVINPVMAYRRGALEQLFTMMEEEKTKTLRIFLNGAQNFKLLQIEPVLQFVSKFNPVILLDWQEPIADNELLSLAEIFPNMTFILTKVMNYNTISAFDILRKRKNVLLDSSWVHNFGVLNTAVDQFGADRVVFGLGYASHNGASVTALLENDVLSLHQKQQIASENISKLLGIDLKSIPTSMQVGHPALDRMRRFREKGVRIVDAHTHIGPTGWWIDPGMNIQESGAKLVHEMDRFGVSQAIVTGSQALFADALEGNRSLEGVASYYPNRFKGYLVFNPAYHDVLIKYLDEFFGRGFFVGFKLLCDYWKVPVTDNRFAPVWSYADTHCLPILIHTWSGGLASPAALKDIVKKYNNAVFILGHSGGNDAGRREAEDLALHNTNVYLEWCGSFVSEIPWEETIEKVGSKKVLYGTDAITHDIAFELGRLMTLNLKDTQIIPILSENMMRILSLRTHN